jgi:hypothetical protein
MTNPGLPAQRVDQDLWEVGVADGEHCGRDVSRRQA